MAVQFQKALIKAFMFTYLWGHLQKQWNIPFPKMTKKIRKLSNRIFQPVPFVFFHYFWDVKTLVYCWCYTEFWSFLCKDVQNLLWRYGFFFYFIKENWLHSKTCFLMLSLLWKICCKWVLKITFFKGKPPALTTLSVNTKEVSKCLCISHSQWLHIQIRGKIPFLEWLVGKPHSDV